MRSSLLFTSWICFALRTALAQFPPAPTNVTTIKSQVNSTVTISYTETDICERTSGVKSYSGFVHLPGDTVLDIGGYDINTYFIYFEARNNPSTAPLAIYLAGGPGESSTYAALSSENGPCYVNIDGTDTVNLTWSFNNHANVLYIDQPVMTGFSYNELLNATFDLELELIIPFVFDPSSPPIVNDTFGYGTYSTQDFNRTVNNTVQAAKALWHFAEHWLSSFPEYTTQSKDISIWGNSYGGYFVPETGVQFSKNLQNLNCSHPLKSKNLTMDAIGITNGCVDVVSGAIGYPEYAYNNTYGIRFGNETIYAESIQNLTMPGGCLDQVQQCRELAQLGDPDFDGSNTTVNEFCMEAFIYCETNVILSFPELNLRDPFDIASTSPSPCPYYLPVNTYLNTGPVLSALGVPSNFSDNSDVVLANFGFPSSYDNLTFIPTADAIRIDGLSNIEYLLANSVKVTFIFGDRDYRCPWTGGIATALAANWTHQSNFAAAGYQQLQGIQTPKAAGGLEAVVKQHGAFSFSRVLESGHTVGAYAPETVYRIFERTLKGVDVATGQQCANETYSTTGPSDSYGWRDVLPDNLPQTCIVNGQFTSTNPWDAITGGSSS